LRGSDTHHLEILSDFDLSGFDSTGHDGTAAGDGERVFNGHKEGLLGLAHRGGDGGLDSLHELQDGVAAELGVAAGGSSQGGASVVWCGAQRGRGRGRERGKRVGEVKGEGLAHDKERETKEDV
jgi:hypothetical protein